MALKSKKHKHFSNQSVHSIHENTRTPQSELLSDSPRSLASKTPPHRQVLCPQIRALLCSGAVLPAASRQGSAALHRVRLLRPLRRALCLSSKKCHRGISVLIYVNVPVCPPDPSSPRYPTEAPGRRACGAGTATAHPRVPRRESSVTGTASSRYTQNQNSANLNLRCTSPNRSSYRQQPQPVLLLPKENTVTGRNPSKDLSKLLLQ